MVVGLLQGLQDLAFLGKVQLAGWLCGMLLTVAHNEQTAFDGLWFIGSQSETAGGGANVVTGAGQDCMDIFDRV